MSDESNFGSFLMGFTVGALAGAIVSLLMAPQTGEETRQVIKEKAIHICPARSRPGILAKKTIIATIMPKIKPMIALFFPIIVLLKIFSKNIS